MNPREDTQKTNNVIHRPHVHPGTKSCLNFLLKKSFTVSLSEFSKKIPLNNVKRGIWKEYIKRNILSSLQSSKLACILPFCIKWPQITKNITKNFMVSIYPTLLLIFDDFLSINSRNGIRQHLTRADPETFELPTCQILLFSKTL